MSLQDCSVCNFTDSTGTVHSEASVAAPYFSMAGSSDNRSENSTFSFLHLCVQLWL